MKAEAEIVRLRTMLQQAQSTLQSLHPSAGLPDSEAASLYNAMLSELNKEFSA